MKASTKQWCLLLGLVAGMVIGAHLAWQSQAAAAAQREGNFSGLGVLIFAPWIAASGGGLGLVTAFALFVVLDFVPSSDESRSKWLTSLTGVGLTLAGLGIVVGILLNFDPSLGLSYGVMVQNLRFRQAETRVARILDLPDEEAIAELQRVIREGDGSAKLQAANALCKFDDNAIVALDDMLDLVFGRYGTQFGGTQFGQYPTFIMQCGPKAAPLIPRLAKALLEPPGIDEREWQRLQLVAFSARVLALIGPASKTAAPELEQVAMSDPVPDNSVSSDFARVAAVRALQSIGADCEVFERLLDSEYENPRYEALLALESKCPERLSLYVEKFLADPSAELRVRALTIASEYGHSIGRQKLIEATNDDDAWVRLAALNQLKINFPQALTPEVISSVASRFEYLTKSSLGSKEMERVLEALNSIDHDAAVNAANRLITVSYEAHQELARAFLERVEGSPKSHSDGCP